MASPSSSSSPFLSSTKTRVPPRRRRHNEQRKQQQNEYTSNTQQHNYDPKDRSHSSGYSIHPRAGVNTNTIFLKRNDFRQARWETRHWAKVGISRKS